MTCYAEWQRELVLWENTLWTRGGLRAALEQDRTHDATVAYITSALPTMLLHEVLAGQRLGIIINQTADVVSADQVARDEVESYGL